MIVTVVAQRHPWKSNISMQTVFWRRKNQKRQSSGTHFWSKNKYFDNGDSLRMTEQEDISPCYIMKQEIGAVNKSSFYHASLSRTFHVLNLIPSIKCMKRSTLESIKFNIPNLGRPRN